MTVDALAFASLARQLGQVCRDRDLVVPAFRSPPRTPNEHRTIRRWGDGQVTVAVAIAGRAWGDVRDDMVDGTVAAQQLPPAAATDLRIALLAATTPPHLEDPAP